MENYLFILFFICLLLIPIIYRTHLYHKMLEVGATGIKNTQEVNHLYDDYFLEKKRKKKELKCELGILRRYLSSSDIQFSVDMLKIPKNLSEPFRILILGTISPQLLQYLLKKSIEVIILAPNIHQAQHLSDTFPINNLTVGLLDYTDLKSTFSNSQMLFHRIIVSECLGKINPRTPFIQTISEMLEPSGFIFLKTLTMIPIFESDRKNLKPKQYQIWEYQKKLIDYWGYNFSTTQSLVNDMTPYFKVKYQEIKLLQLIWLFNYKDIKKILQLYFLDMGYSYTDLHEWRAISNLNYTIFKLYPLNYKETKS